MPMVGQPARGRVSLWIRIVAGVATAGLLAFLVGFFWFIDRAGRLPAIDGPRTEAMVALTGGSARVNDAVTLLGQGRARRLLITGVHHDVGEREIARAVPGARPLMDCCIDLDHRALNTLGNALETRRWVRVHGFKSVTVVTSNYHMPRTMLELRRLMPNVAFFSHQVRSEVIRVDEWWRDWQTFRILSLEYVKFLMAAIHLRLDRAIDATLAPTSRG